MPPDQPIGPYRDHEPERLGEADRKALEADARAAAAEARADGLLARLTDAQADRDRWRDLAERLSRPVEPRPGLLDRIGTLFRR